MPPVPSRAAGAVTTPLARLKNAGCGCGAAGIDSVSCSVLGAQVVGRPPRNHVVPSNQHCSIGSHRALPHLPRRLPTGRLSHPRAWRTGRAVPVAVSAALLRLGRGGELSALRAVDIPTPAWGSLARPYCLHHLRGLDVLAPVDEHAPGTPLLRSPALGIGYFGCLAGPSDWLGDPVHSFLDKFTSEAACLATHSRWRLMAHLDSIGRPPNAQCVASPYDVALAGCVRSRGSRVLSNASSSP